MPAACQSSLLHPSTFAFRGFEGAKRQRLCRPSGNPVGVNLAGVSLFRMRAHGWRWGLWRAFGMADAARFCSGPLRPPNQCLPLAKASCFNRPPLLLVGAKVPNGSGSADLVATRWAWILLGFPCFGCVLTGDAGGCDVPWNGWCRTVLLRAVTFAQPMPAACQSSLLHPSTFAFRGFEGAKRQRLCRPSGNPVGVNLAGVSLFRMRAHGWRWGLWRAFGRAVTFAQPMPAACQSSLLHPSTFAFRGFEGAKQQRLCQPSGNPVGVNLAGVSLFWMRAHGWRWGLWRAFGTADAARCCLGPLRSPNQCLLLAKLLPASPLEWLMPHGFAQGRYVRPTNACCLPKLPVSPFHLCF